MRRSLLLPLAGLVAVTLAACSRPAPEPEPLRAVRTMTVGAAAVSSSHEYAAEVRARTESRIGFRVGGKLLARDVELGTAVRAGQRLARLDPRDLQLGQLGAQAALSSAEASLGQAEADFRRYTELRDQGFISSAELERRETTLKSARAQVAQARAQAGVQGNQAAYATLSADVGGVVTAIEAEPGQVVAAGQPVLRLAHDGPRDVVFSVPEDRAAQLHALLGRAGALQVTLWGSDAVLPATVREVAAATDATTRTLLVKADLGRAPVVLGQTATVTIALPRDAAAIKLPLTALVQSDGRTAVWLLDAASMTVKPQPVQLAGAEGNLVLVAAGLVPGQEVVTAGVHVLTAGQSVRRYGGDAADTVVGSADASDGQVR
ncbi:MAG TPA: efflux RND transporter periplasmic adaptor subunit [Methylibium sp.]|nr:efflux RND transporter periplasmic adaptor subunit [Methylibium sp.]